MDTWTIERLTFHIDDLPKHFMGGTDEKRLHKETGRWSPQEILGHLVDSAINNLKRFTEIQFLPQPYKVIGYRQEELVLVNNYQQLPLSHIISLWQQLNKQVIYVIENIPEAKLTYPVIISSGESKTLEWLITDYVVHLEHHINQIRERL